MQSASRVAARPKRLLLLTPNTMNHLTGGTILFRSFLARIPADELWWAVAGGSDPVVPDWMRAYRREVFTSRLFSRPARGIGRKTFAGPAWRYLAYDRGSKRAAKQIEAFIRREEIEAMWVLANGLSIPVAARLQTDLGIPVHVSVQDDIDGQLARPEADALRTSFRTLMQSARSVDVTSDSMLRYYDERYGIGAKSIVVYPNVGGRPANAPVIRDRVETIGFAGILWASDAFEGLLGALDRLNRHREKKITLAAYGQLFPSALATRPWVDFRGTMSPDAMPGLLQQCDLLYAPMSFEKRQEILSRTSMPAKLFSYVHSQVPLIAHGPSYATNVQFVKDKRVGWAITTQSPDEIATIIDGADRDVHARREAANRCRQLISGELSTDRNWERLDEALRAL